MNSWTRIIVLVMVIGGAGWGISCKRESTQSLQQKGLVPFAQGLPTGFLWRQDFVFADMDGDGLADIVTAPPRKSQEPWPHIFLRRQNSWEPVSCPGVANNGFPSQEYAYGGVAVADFDRDGNLDIAIAMHETGMRIFSSRAKGPCGPWEEVQNLPKAMVNRRSRAIVAADMNKDGRMDLVALAEAPDKNAGDNTAGITICWNEVGGWRTQKIEGSEGLFGDDITIGEVNGDGTPDIAVGSLNDQRPQFVWLSDGKGGWQAASPEGFAANIIAWTVQLVDFDNDGKDELLLGVGGAPVYQNGGPRVYRWDGAHWSDLSRGLPQVSWVCGVTAIDLDKDGRKEIVAAEMYTGRMQVYGQQADGTWVERQNFQAVDIERLRNYKIHALLADKSDQSLIAANYAGESNGKIAAWVWRSGK